MSPRSLGEARPYGMGRMELSPLFSGSWSASGGVLELGARFGDLVGRTDVIALGAISNDGGVSGGVVSGVSRRWPIEVGFRAIAANESPSEHDFEEGFVPRVDDRERLALEGEGFKRLRWRAADLTLGGGAWWSSIDGDAGESVDQWGVFVRAAYEGRPTSGKWTYPQSLSLDVANGSTESETFTRIVGRISFGVLRKGTGLELAVGRGDVDDDAHPWDRFEVGGLRTSLHAGSAVFGNRVWAPGLPFGALAGSSFTRYRGAVVLSFVPVKGFYERIEVSRGPFDESIDLAGIEYETRVESMPLVRIPGATISAGVSVAFDEPVKDEVHGWVGLRWSP